MRTETSKGFLRLQYKAPDYQFGQVELEFELQAHRTVVQSVIEVMPSPHTKQAQEKFLSSSMVRIWSSLAYESMGKRIAMSKLLRSVW